MAKQRNGVGASLLRKEDDRHLRGRGQFVADIALRGTQEVVFLRSPHAHADIRSISVPPAARGQVFTAADLPRIKPIRVVTQAAGARSPPWPPLATDKVRYVGEAIAACVAPTRAEAEDLAAAVTVDYRPLDAVVDAQAARAGSPALVHEYFGDNLFQERTITGGDIEAAARAAEITVSREYRMNRQSGAPMECRGVLAYRDHRLDEVVVYASTQTPHTMRVALGEILGIEERCIRVVAPDVGGGFGPKARLYPEEIILDRARLATRPSGALDRGSQRTSADRRPYPRSSLPGHRLCRPAGQDPRHRLRDHRGCRRVRHVAARSLSGSQHGGAHPAGPLCDPALPRPHLHGRDQQDADRSVSRGRPPRRLLRGRADDRRGRPRGRPRSCRGAHREHDPAGTDALRLDHRHALRHRRLPGKRAALRRVAEPGGRSAHASDRASRTGGSSASASPASPSRPHTAPPSSPRAVRRSSPVSKAAPRAS